MKVEDEDIMYFNTFFFYYIYSYTKGPKRGRSIKYHILPLSSTTTFESNQKRSLKEVLKCTSQDD